MAIKRLELRLDSIPKRERPAQIAALVEWLQAKLEERFQKSVCEWSTGGQATISVTRGDRWGFSVRFKPQEVSSRAVRVIVQQAVPSVVTKERWIVAIAGGLGFLVGLAAFGIQAWQSRGARTSVEVGMVFGLIAAVAAGGLGLLLLLPLRLLAERRMQPETEQAFRLVEDTWEELRAARTGLGAASHKKAPALIYAVSCLAFAAAGCACYYFARLPDTSQGAGIFLLVLACICAFATVGLFVAIFFALFGFME